MDSHQLTVAKASLVAACLRPDVTKVSRDDINHFHVLLEACLLRCSPTNIQNCKIWLLDHIVPSLHRTTALGKYLAGVCRHIIHASSQSSYTPNSSSRQRLHLLYVINDVLHHAKYHTSESTLRVNLEQGLHPVISEIFLESSSSCKRRVKTRLQELLRIWEEHRYFQKKLLQDISIAVTEGQGFQAEASSNRPSVKELPYIMPGSHGDPSVPFYDLPAANLMPHIIPNAPTPMRADQIRPLQLSAGPADESLVRAVKDFLNDVERLDDPYTNPDNEEIGVEIDEIGQISYQNRDNELVGETYYGWSRNFCEKMKSRAQEQYARSRSGSRGSLRKRQKRGRSRSWSGSDSDSQDMSRSRSYSPVEDKPQFGTGRNPPPIVHYSDPRGQDLSGSRGPLGFHPPPLGPGNMPIPPPRPMNWNGPWPPPLPAALNANAPNMQFAVPIPPPPPPPSS